MFDLALLPPTRPHTWTIPEIDPPLRRCVATVLPGRCGCLARCRRGGEPVVADKLKQRHLGLQPHWLAE